LLSELPFECPENLLSEAKQHPPAHVAIAGAESVVVMESARAAYEAGLIQPYFVGVPDHVLATADEIEWDISAFELEGTSEEGEISARAVALARSGLVDSLMKGSVHTDSLMRAVLDRETGLRTAQRLSHVFHMTVPGRDGQLLLTDCAVNVSPDVETQVHITRNAVSLAHALGIGEPHVAVLSATESVSHSMPSSRDANEVARRCRAGEVEGAVVEGPFALDVAISMEAAAVKGVKSAVAGKADILVFPNIEAGNALFKAMVYFLSATAAGVVLGAKVPIVLTSRADPPEARLAATALAAILAKHG